MAEEGFLARWSRRKAQAGQAQPDAGPAQPPVPDAVPLGPPGPPAAVPAEVSAPADAPAAAPASPPPTLEDAQRLDPGADVSRFMAPDVDRTVRHAALKKLFSDPHFNRMDGLDVYIEDYTQFTPVSQTVLRRMVQAQALGLWREERTPNEGPEAKPHGADGGNVPQCPDPATSEPAADAGREPAHDEDPDLQLQSHDAPGRGGPEPGAGSGGR
ncbi:MAG: DUF3306 domain-containing protein [Caldimonas sp.]|uniref:DUF3306 domain-containing protein n=1 Tax=Caldimonas sp. TaxID=2838790 RepID=UPI00391B0B76